MKKILLCAVFSFNCALINCMPSLDASICQIIQTNDLSVFCALWRGMIDVFDGSAQFSGGFSKYNRWVVLERIRNGDLAPLMLKEADRLGSRSIVNFLKWQVPDLR